MSIVKEKQWAVLAPLWWEWRSCSVKFLLVFFLFFFLFSLRTVICFSSLQVVPGHYVFISVELQQAMIVTCCSSPCVRRHFAFPLRISLFLVLCEVIVQGIQLSTAVVSAGIRICFSNIWQIVIWMRTGLVAALHWLVTLLWPFWR